MGESKRYTNLNLKEAENIFIQDFPRKVDYVAVSINSDMEDLLQKSNESEFCSCRRRPEEIYRIVTRKSIMEYCYEKIKKIYRKTIDLFQNDMLYSNSMPHNEVQVL